MARNTKTAIIHSFLKLMQNKKPEDINIKDITDGCDVNRKTFYYYFADIEDLMEQTLDYEVKTFYSALPKGTATSDAVAGFFKIIKQNEDIFLHIYNSGKNHLVEKHIHSIIYSVFRNNVNSLSEGRNISDLQKDKVASAFTFIATGFISKWVDEGMQEDVDSLVGSLHAMLFGADKLMLDNAESLNNNLII
ncbi:MAG: TetR/AcrR family transcriptional regulator [Clostridia bacterium]|nr:TetR/AcrR family transcriptional regulator [Clostridia bacterium]